MDELGKKNIGLAICGGIAAFKTAELASLLVKKGYHVFPIMTPTATNFIQPLTLEALTWNPVFISGTDARTPGGMDHINLVRSLDLLVIAPLTANTCAKLANGFADHFLSAAYLAYTGQTLVCPAMNTAMLEHPATVRNLDTLKNDGVRFCMGEPGVLACGEVGVGRMAEPAVIAEYIDELVSPSLPDMEGEKVLINAGPTIEDLDPVRFLSNRSTGKMGFALARAFRNAGANVTLVHGPVNIPVPARVRAIPVRSAEEMAEQCLSHAVDSKIVVLSAAVADFTPQPLPLKLKKSEFNGIINLTPTLDILKTLGAKKTEHQILIGFAAETHDEELFALKKLKEKNADLIFCNQVGAEKYGFASDENVITAYSQDKEASHFGPGLKEDLAQGMVQYIQSLFFEN